MLHKHILQIGLAILVVGGAVLTWSAPAEAGQRTGTWRNGMVAGPYGPGYYTTYYYGSSRYTHRGPWGAYGPSYVPARYSWPHCYTVRRSSMDPWGRVTTWRTRVCD